MKKKQSSKLSKKEFAALKQELIQDSEFLFPVVTDSMAPIITVGEIIVVKPLPQRLKPFDIIVFYQFEKLICHFVWHQNEKIGKTVITRNLNEGKFDLPVSEEEILGIVSNKNFTLWQKWKFILLHRQ